MTKTTTQFRALIWAAMAVAPLSIGSNAAISKITDDPPSVTVRFSDVNIDTPQGRQVLYRRIRAAAILVCGRGRDALQLELRNAYGKCVVTAIQDAVNQVHSDGLTALYDSKVGAHPNSRVVRTASVR